MKELLIRLLFFAVLLGGCAPAIPFTQVPLEPTRHLEAGDLIDPLWLDDVALFRVRQTALFEIRGRKVSSEGIMRLDPGARTARLVALEGMGVKLFDLSISADSFEVNHLMPQLEAYPGFTEAVAESVRRIFFDPRPTPDDILHIDRETYRLSRSVGDDRIDFLFGGSEPLLLEKSMKGPGGAWRVRYYQYRPVSGRQVPHGIVLEDRRSGYRLTLWLERVERIDE